MDFKDQEHNPFDFQERTVTFKGKNSRLLLRPFDRNASCHTEKFGITFKTFKIKNVNQGFHSQQNWLPHMKDSDKLQHLSIQGIQFSQTLFGESTRK